MTLVLTQWMAFPKPTHLNSHLLFCNRTHQLKKAKESASQRTQTIQQFSVKLGGNSFGKEEGKLVTAPNQKAGFRVPKTDL
jgi:hypothetical protein